MKKAQKEELFIHLIDLRDFMFTHDENTWCTERELAARIVNNMIMSLSLNDRGKHKYVSVLGLRECGVSNEGCQEDLICSADTYRSKVKKVIVREFADGNGGVYKVKFPIWLQSPFEDEKIISDSWTKALFEIVSKWGERPITVVLVTKKDRAPNLEEFAEFMSKLVTSNYSKLKWSVIDTSEWKTVEIFKPNGFGGSKKGVV